MNDEIFGVEEYRKITKIIPNTIPILPADYDYWWPQCRVDPIRLHPPLYQLRKLRADVLSVKAGRAVAQAVSRWLPTAAARFRVRAACGVCGGQSGTGAGFLRVLRFSLPIIPPISPSS
jgi:hypothetical protein